MKLEYDNQAYSNWYWSYYYNFYLYIRNELFPNKITDFKLLDKVIDWNKKIHYIEKIGNICLISDRPEYIMKNTRGLHNEHGPALKYRDTFSIYALNGICVPNWSIETPKDDIDVKKVLEIPNTEVRHVLMRHIGLSKFLKSLKAEEIDKQDDYKLYYITIEDVKIGPYLLMKCPSTGREYLEGVGDASKYENIDPTIKTVNEALQWRFNKASSNLFNNVIDINSLKYRA